jgi:type IV secretory pathway VirJ component
MSTLMKLSATNPIAKRVMDAYNPDQPRDERGRWGAGGSVSQGHEMTAASHTEAARVLTSQGRHYAATLHSQAATAHTQAANASKRVKTDKQAVGVVSETRRAAFEASNKAGKESPLVNPQAPGQAGHVNYNPAAEGSRVGASRRANTKTTKVGATLLPGTKRDPFQGKAVGGGGFLHGMPGLGSRLR